MEINVYQKLALTTKLALPLEYFLGKLITEAGELLDIYYKNMRDNDGVVKLTTNEKLQMADEIGDCEWYLNIIANELGFDLAPILQNNLNKLNDRQKKGQLKRR